MRRFKVTFTGSLGERWRSIVDADDEIKAVNKAWEHWDSPDGYTPMKIEQIDIHETN